MQYAFGPLSALGNVRSFGTMERKIRFAAILLAFAATGGCGWTTGAPGPMDTQRRASPVAEVTDGGPPTGELFLTDAPLRFVLEADFSLLEGDRSQESEERPAWVILPGRDGEAVEIPVEVKTRGRFRLRPDICTMPPLRLDFPSTELRGTVFDGADKVKLVTHCQDQRGYKENLLEEFLAYRLYNLITDVSFRVQLAEITYLDTSGQHRPVTRRAFLLEDKKALAARLGGEILEVPGLEVGMLHPGELGLMYLFQYMIGNTDWSTESGHNIEFIRTPETIFAVPFDFDFSGLVDAPYATPASSVAGYIRSVRERVYLGDCVDGIDHEDVLGRFREARQDILALVEARPGLSFSKRLSAQRYLQEFFKDLGYPELVERNIVLACRR